MHPRLFNLFLSGTTTHDSDPRWTQPNGIASFQMCRYFGRTTLAHRSVQQRGQGVNFAHKLTQSNLKRLLWRQQCQTLRLPATNAETHFPLVNENRNTLASAASAIRSVASLAATRGVRTSAAPAKEEEEAAPNAKGSKSCAINAARPTVCPSSHRRAAPCYAVLASAPAAHKTAAREVRELST